MNSKVAGTKGGQAALDILLGAYGGEDSKEGGPQVEANTEKMPEIPNALARFSFGTKMGMNTYFPKKQNQDAYICAPQVMDHPHCHFFAVLDGHGAVGKEITATVENRLAQLVDSELE